MTLLLREFQESAIEKVRDAIRTGHKRIILYSPTGSGKTQVAMAIIKSAQEKSKNVTFICNRINLVKQASKRFYRSNISHGIVQGDNTRQAWEKVLVCSIQTLDKRGYPANQNVMIIDEAHSATSASYRKIINEHPDAIIIGLTATPFTRGLGLIFETMVIATTIREQIALGFLVDCEIYAPDSPDLTGVKIVRGDYDEKQLGVAVDKPHLVGNIVKHWKTYASGMPTVVFATNIAHSQHIAAEFVANGVNAEHIDCYTPEEERAAINARIETGETMIVSNVDIYTEGWDCLDSATEILLCDGWHGIRQVSVGDKMYALNRDSGDVEIVEVAEYVERPVIDGERMVEFVGQHTNIRVTEGHEFHVKTSRTSPELHTIVAAELIGRPGEFSMPISGECEFTGIDLSDDELKFIAWFMTDGGFNGCPSEIAINQSEAKPQYVIEIRDLLTRLEFDFRERIRAPAIGSYQTTNNSHEFSIPKGNHSGSMKRKGWAHLSPYLDKRVSEMLHHMSRRQFDVFWKEMLKGDGEQQGNKSGWLWCFEKAQADAYTHMAVVRGFAASFSTRMTKNGVTMYRVSVRDKKFLSIRPKDIRATKIISTKPLAGERVWCVRNRNSTIIVRRKGKIAIVGNCPKIQCVVNARPTRSMTKWIQRVGRGLRPYPGKTIATILDHSGTCHLLGYPTDDLPLELNNGKKSKASEKDDQPQEEKLPRECPACHYMIPPGFGACPKCGATVAKKNKVKHEDGELKKLERQELSHADKQELWSSALGVRDARNEKRVAKGKTPLTEAWAANLYKSITHSWPSGLENKSCVPLESVVKRATANDIKFLHRRKT